VHIPLRLPDFSVDWQRVKDAVTARTRMILVNSPHNPSGAVFSPADLDMLAEITRGTEILVLSDEVYEHIVFGPARHVRPATLPSLAEYCPIGETTMRFGNSRLRIVSGEKSFDPNITSPDLFLLQTQSNGVPRSHPASS